MKSLLDVAVAYLLVAAAAAQDDRLPRVRGLNKRRSALVRNLKGKDQEEYDHRLPMPDFENEVMPLKVGPHPVPPPHDEPVPTTSPPSQQPVTQTPAPTIKKTAPPYEPSSSSKGKGKGANSKKSSKSKKSKAVLPPGKGKGALPKKKVEPPASKKSAPTAKMQKVPIGKGKGFTPAPFGKGKGFGTPAPTPKEFMPTTPGAPTPKPTSMPSRAPSPGGCRSKFTNYVLSRVPEAIAANPSRCCDFDGPTAAFVTHSEPGDTASGFEIFWDILYQEIEKTASKAGVCFFMTGYDPAIKTDLTLSELLIEVNQVVSGISEVPAMMSTDPTTGLALIKEIRVISNNPGLPSIGVFNAGFNNILEEQIESGQAPLPFVGYPDDTVYGQLAAQATQDLLDGVPPSPLCFNGRPGEVSVISARCQAYYTRLGVQRDPSTGVSCNINSTADEILQDIVNANANAVLSHIDCCAAASDAVRQARQQGRTVVIGCMDYDTAGVSVDFVTVQPERLQAYSTSTWVNFPVIQENRGNDGRGKQFFPSLDSLVHTAIFNQFLM